MKSSLILILLFVVLAVGLAPAAAQSCPYFTKIQPPGLLPVGTIVDFTNYEAPGGGAMVRTGTVDEYFISTDCPQYRPFGMDGQAYVVKYAAADGSRRILSQREMTVR